MLGAMPHDETKAENRSTAWHFHRLCLPRVDAPDHTKAGLEDTRPRDGRGIGQARNLNELGVWTQVSQRRRVTRQDKVIFYTITIEPGPGLEGVRLSLSS